MKKIIIAGLMLLSLSLIPRGGQITRSLVMPADSLSAIIAEGPLTVSLQAASAATITFKSNNGRSRGNTPARTAEIPHLVLFRNGALTPVAERSLSLSISGLELPPAGLTVDLLIETQNGDPDQGGANRRIPVWRESRWLANDSGAAQPGAPVVFNILFQDKVNLPGGPVTTPSGYFRYEILIGEGQNPAVAPLHKLSQDDAFLMESQWIAPLPAVTEATPGAAPDELVVYYADMFPFQKDIHDPATWLRRDQVHTYLQTELVPAMVEAFRMQSHDWGFPWHEAWTGFRLGQDKDRLSVALVGGSSWFHGQAPSRGRSAISIQVTGGENAAYDTLTDGLMSTFHHELFHNLQQNISQHYGQHQSLGGAEGAWEYFSEGTAVLASSIAQRDLQFAPAVVPRAYMANAQYYLGGSGMLTDLNRSYAKTSPYRAALYWRFLYEQCGGMANGVENPAAGLEVIKSALTILYSRQIVDISASTDLVGHLPQIMDQTLASSASCPFRTYQESLIQFAQAIYQLRLAGGRCLEPGLPAGCGLYDPFQQYPAPPVAPLD
jgi:hypothetical protein